MARPTKRQQINKKIGLGVSKMSDERISKLEEAFAMDCTVKEACLNADISVDTYYERIKKNPKLSERFETLRETPVFIARQSVIRDLKTNSELALKYLSKKKKKEFADRVENTGPDGEAQEMKISWID